MPVVSPSARRPPRGFTLVELLIVLVLMAIALSVVAPAFGAIADRARTRGALNQLTGDLFYARMLAVRAGRQAVLRFEPDPACAPRRGGKAVSRRYRIVVREVPERLVKVVELGDAPGLCLEVGRSDSIAFNGRGLLAVQNRKVWAWRGAVGDSLSLSAVGRTYRWY